MMEGLIFEGGYEKKDRASWNFMHVAGLEVKIPEDVTEIEHSRFLLKFVGLVNEEGKLNETVKEASKEKINKKEKIMKEFKLEYTLKEEFKNALEGFRISTIVTSDKRVFHDVSLFKQGYQNKNRLKRFLYAAFQNGFEKGFNEYYNPINKS